MLVVAETAESAVWLVCRMIGVGVIAALGVEAGTVGTTQRPLAVRVAGATWQLLMSRLDQVLPATRGGGIYTAVHCWVSVQCRLTPAIDALREI